MNLVLKKMMPITMISVLGFAFFSKSVSALRISDNNSPLEYVCSPYGIAAYLRESDVEDWECARLKFLPSGELRVRVFKNEWKGDAILPSLGNFSSPVTIDLADQKSMIFDCLSISMEDEKVVECSFFVNHEEQNYKFEFSLLTKEISLLKEGKLHKSFQLNEEWQSEYAQVIGLGISMIVTEII